MNDCDFLVRKKIWNTDYDHDLIWFNSAALKWIVSKYTFIQRKFKGIVENPNIRIACAKHSKPIFAFSFLLLKVEKMHKTNIVILK